MKRQLWLATLFIAVTIQVAAQKSDAPTPGPSKPFNLPVRQAIALPNGAKLNLVPYGAIPKVQISLYIRAASLNEPADKVWLSNLTASLMREGTKTKTAEEVDAAFARMGGRLIVNAGDDDTVISADVLSEHAAEAASLLAEVATSPRLPEPEVARLKNDLLRTLVISRSQPQFLAQERFSKVMYGDHPYGRVPTEEMIKGYTIDDVRKFYYGNFGAQRTRVYVVGRFDVPKVKAALTESLGKWEKGPVATVGPPKLSSRRDFELVDKPGAVQSTLNIGLPVADPSNPDYVALAVTNALLGGSFISRITQNIRESKGYTYSPFSQVQTHYRAAAWVQSADVTTAVTGPSMKEIFGEIEGLRDKAPSADELSRIQRYMCGVFVLQNSSRGGLTNQLSFVDAHGLGDQYLRTFTQNVNAVTPAKVRAIAEKYLDPAHMTIVVVGDPEKINAQVAPYREASAGQ